jgi:hypothetical protein
VLPTAASDAAYAPPEEAVIASHHLVSPDSRYRRLSADTSIIQSSSPRESPLTHRPDAPIGSPSSPVKQTASRNSPAVAASTDSEHRSRHLRENARMLNDIATRQIR